MGPGGNEDARNAEDYAVNVEVVSCNSAYEGLDNQDDTKSYSC